MHKAQFINVYDAIVVVESAALVTGVAIKLARLLPFLLGGVIGVELVHWTSPATLRISIGIVLILFSLYNLMRPQLAPVAAGKAAVGDRRAERRHRGATGFAGIVVTIWCTLRDEEGIVFQPTGVGVFLITGIWLGGTGLVDAETLWLFVIGLPLLLAGTWVGLRLYARLDEAGFRKVVLGLLLISGLGLVVRGS
jgi:uncharacterized membrane protein YfcA